MTGALEHLTSLPDFRLEVFLGTWEFAAKHHLTASDAQTLTVGELLALAGDKGRAALEELPLTYSPTWGATPLLEAIAATYGPEIGPEHVLTFAGAEEAMFWALLELVGPGDHAVVTVPGYQSMEALPRASGADVDGWLVRPDTSSRSGWRLDLDELVGLLRPTTKLVAINLPHNPTGHLMPPADFEALVALCQERGIRLFSDEVYRGLELESGATLPQAADRSPTAVSLNVLSKAYGLPGLRLGWLVCRDRALLERLERLKHYTSICSSGPSEVLGTIALQHGDAIRQRNRSIIAANRPVFAGFFAEWEELFEFAPPAGGCVCFPRWLGAEPVGDWCRRLVQEAGVVLLPADIYASELADVPDDRFRIGVGRRDPEPGLAALAAFLRR